MTVGHRSIPQATDRTDWCRHALIELEEFRRDLLSQAHALRFAAAYQAMSKGKRLRPTVLLCFALMGQAAPRPTPAILRAAAATEILHEGSLIHDDILDNCLVRRDRPSLPERFGVSAASLLGANMVLVAVSVLADCCAEEGVALNAGLLRELCQAQIEEGLTPHSDPAAQRQRWLRIIDGKTGSLFKLAAEVGAAFARPDECRRAAQQGAAPFTKHLARAFQLRDDLADLENDALLRKPGGSDLVRGLPTLPFQIWAASLSDPQSGWDRLLNCRNDPDAAESLRRQVICSDTPPLIRGLIRAELDAARAVLGEMPACPALTTLDELIQSISPEV